MGLPLNKILKRVLMGFAILCGIVLIVFCIELILINREPGEAGTGSVISGDGQNGEGDEGTEPDANGETPPNGVDTGTQPDQNNTPDQGARPDPVGTRHEELVTGGVLSFYVDESLFGKDDIERLDDIAVFSWRGDGNASLQISMVFFSLGVQAFAEEYQFLDLNADESDVQGEDFIGRSSLRGILVIGASGASSLETWIYSSTGVGNEGLGLVFTVSYQNVTQRSAIYDILGTLEIDYS